MNKYSVALSWQIAVISNHTQQSSVSVFAMFSCHDQSTANAAYRYPTYSFKLSSYVAHRRCNKNSCSSICQHWSLGPWYKCSTCAVPSSGVKLLQAKVCPV